MSAVELDLSNAGAAVAEALHEEFSGEPYVAKDYEPMARRLMYGALPHILEALAAKAEDEAPNRDYVPRMFGGEPFPDISTPGSAARWLRELAEEARA